MHLYFKKKKTTSMISTTWYNAKRYLKIYIIPNMISIYPLTRILVSLIQELVSTIVH